MTLIVEDGTGRADAESYASVATANSYHQARGSDAWDLLDDPAKEQALRCATDYMGQAYRMRWAGYRVSNTQALDWPRYEVPRPDSVSSTLGYGGFSYYASDAVPAEVQKACCELAIRAAAGELAADLDAPVVREKLGPIETEYAVGQRQTKKYQAVDALLAPLLTGSGSSMKVSRA